ncbi:hypothetical protein QG37_00423 [Candidozyma auris]|uniref:Uncharacterized protein n=1 Tax=Candidozyma auris TaxID=498019 RepID=A0A0L0P8G2_CANAR|nr:hypothetical protein QG37_00423 [[Candida] auris]
MYKALLQKEGADDEKKKKIHDIITSACIVREGAPWPM